MEDIDFILLVSYIFRNRSFNSDVDPLMTDVSDWLVSEKMIMDNKNVDPESFITINLKNESEVQESDVQESDVQESYAQESDYEESDDEDDEESISENKSTEGENNEDQDEQTDEVEEVSNDIINNTDHTEIIEKGNKSIENCHRLIDVLNRYNPSINIRFILNEPKQNLITNRLKLNSYGSIDYSIEGNWTFSLGSIHGGDIKIDGNLNPDSFIGVFRETPSDILMRSKIHINGDLMLTRGQVIDLFENLIKRVILSKDDDILGFEIVSNKLPFPVDDLNHVIRDWKIVVENDSKFKMSIVKIHNPL